MPPSCALLGGFAIGASVVLLWQHKANANVSEYMLVLALCLVVSVGGKDLSVVTALTVLVVQYSVTFVSQNLPCNTLSNHISMIVSVHLSPLRR